VHTEQAPDVHVWILEQHVFVPQTVPLPTQATAEPVQVEFALLPHEVPPVQHALPHGVVPPGQPQVPLDALTHAMPALQQHGPHGVVPAAHGNAPAVVPPVHDAP
jgi:hypothetical protein